MRKEVTILCRSRQSTVLCHSTSVFSWTSAGLLIYWQLVIGFSIWKCHY